MPLQRLLDGSGLGADDVKRLCCAYEHALRILYLLDRNDPVSEIVARKIIELGTNGGDPVEIAERAVRALGTAQ